MTCRICGAGTRQVLDLGTMPPANRLKHRRDEPETMYPLVLEKCYDCFNLQLRDCVDEAELYGEYVYLTPDSESLREHYATLTERLMRPGLLDAGSFVMEIGSNIGRFLEYLAPRTGRVLGVDPARNVCELAIARGIPTSCGFFNRMTAPGLSEEHGRPDVIVARHCCAHNRDPHEFVGGVAQILPDSGVFVMENAYAPDTLLNINFDQIYHEHMFYFSLQSVERLFAMHGMRIIDVMMSPIHGGTAVFVAAPEAGGREPVESVARLRETEKQVLNDGLLSRFVFLTREIRDRVREQILRGVDKGESVWTYGATAKGATLLNFMGLNNSHIECCVDSTKEKQGLFLPKANIEVRPEEDAFATPPDWFLLTAWNYADEIIGKHRAAGNTTSRFIIPSLSVTVR